MEDEDRVQDPPPEITEQPEPQPEAPQNDGASSISGDSEQFVIDENSERHPFQPQPMNEARRKAYQRVTEAFDEFKRTHSNGEMLTEDTEAAAKAEQARSEITESEKAELEAVVEECAATYVIAEETPQVLEIKEHTQIQRKGSIWEVTVLVEGWSLNGRYYPRECLQEAQKIWEGARVYAYGWDPTGKHHQLDHVPPHIEREFPEGTYLNEVGFLKGVNLVIESGRGRLKAQFCVTKDSTRDALLKTEEMGGQLPGFSIHGNGELQRGIAEGREGLIVTRITKRKELTIVSEPAAGGRFERLVASLQQNREDKKEMKHEKLRQFLAEHLPKSLREGVQKMDAPSVLEAVHDVHL